MSRGQALDLEPQNLERVRIELGHDLDERGRVCVRPRAVSASGGRTLDVRSKVRPLR